MDSEFQIPNLPPTEDYRFAGSENVMTPALVIYPEYVDSNIRETIRLLGGQPDRWRPHVKTSKLAFVMKRFVDHGVTTFKCSTTLELLTICGAGAADVLIAYPMTGPGARRVREIAAMYPEIRVSVLVESPQQVQQWAGSGIGVFIDVNPGMDRTGIPQANADVIINLAEFVSRQGIPFRGVHYYDGHLSMPDLAERQAAAHKGYDALVPIIDELERRDLGFGELITAGTPAFPCSASYNGFAGRRFLHRASPGTVVYADCSSLNSLPKEYGYRPAAVVMSTVVSRPSSSIITCDAGHKTVSADAGVPTCAVLGHPHLTPLKPSEEHLPVEVSDGAQTPEIGDNLFLVPRHICPTVNNFDHAVIVSNGRIVGVEKVTARGREAPLRF
jgi:D-serine deaminase-like pyridoxal phosphate-dependent protein